MAHARYPHSLALNLGRGYELRGRSLPSEARPFVERAVRCAPRSPYAWLILSSTIGEQAQQIRKARFVNDLTPVEFDTCRKYYDEQVPAALKGAFLDGESATAWLEVSSAAAFAGAEELAVGGFEKAIGLAPDDSAVLSWGLQLYQPKWYDNAERLQQVAELAVKSAINWPAASRLRAATAMEHGGLSELARRMLLTPAEKEAFDEHFRRRPVR